MFKPGANFCVHIFSAFPAFFRQQQTRERGLIGEHHLPAFPHQQRLILLGDGTDVIPQQGDPLELAQVLPAVHPELQGTQVNPMNTGANRYEHPCSSICCYKHCYKPRLSREADNQTRQAVPLQA